ncbi:protein xmas [Adelges cooleyi]|uniref:protein xmas n=1 Tax=Adelges cooleyi TaxID=133065 RepID=UPI00218031A9|nr:protein xmas [Adelges cooleyi]
MGDGRINNTTNSRLKRSNYEEDRAFKDEPPVKTQRMFSPLYEDQGTGIIPSYENADVSEDNYKNIPAISTLKKLQVLECRDKFLRASATQPTIDVNVDEIKPMKGTCLDMCPEKERLLRIVGNMVSHFECRSIDSKLEPAFEIMVKAYARSSADQANPLSHELRPTPVLVKTMNYMLKNIIQPIESNTEQDLASWYDFCWDRLRAIRKDIVQQNLQNPEVITILEQIGRFHIACYDLMLGYPGFDIKLNTENLNNCIQMLMPMYRDADHKCSNEPEFVSYELLMHLGNPQFHTAYDLLPTHLKQTPQVRFCNQAHITYLQSGDCLEFFRLLKTTTFMNCCILERIIPSVRYNTIKMMNLSYTTFKRTYKLEIEHVVSKLCFDDIASAKEFCSEVQLKCDGFFVELSRKKDLCAPEYRNKKQESIIIQKRQNLTYLISGMEQLPSVIIDSIHSSFDDDDCLITYNEEDEHIDVDDSDSVMETNSVSSFSKDFSIITDQSQFQTFKIQEAETPTFTFKLPKPSVSPTIQKLPVHSEVPWKQPSRPRTLSKQYEDESSIHGNLSVNNAETIENSSNLLVTIPDALTISPTLNSQCLQPIQSPFRSFHSEKLLFKKLTERQIYLAKKYFNRWQNFVAHKKAESIAEVFSHNELFHYTECISSLSSSPSSLSSSVCYTNESILLEEPKEWTDKQVILAKKYFYLWLRRTLRRRRTFEIDPVNSLPWSVFMQVHGTPNATLQSITSKSKKLNDGQKGSYLLNEQFLLQQSKLLNDNISINIADMFIKNILNSVKNRLIGNKVFWKVAVNYGTSSMFNCLEDKVKTIIYGKIGFGHSQVQAIFTDYFKWFIKSVHSSVGLQDWTKCGLNAAIVFTATDKEDMETLFKRVDSILQSTPTAIPFVMILSSSSNKKEILNYKAILDTYKENDYITNYSIYIWEGPMTILKAIEFFSINFVDTVPGMTSEKLYYSLINFAESFFLKVRHLIPESNPNTIIEKYNQSLNAYIKRLGKNNDVLKYLAPEFVPHYTQEPEKFLTANSNLNLEYFENILNSAHLPLYESWPPQCVDDLVEYVKKMCHLTNRRCWYLDILQMLQLDRKIKHENCFSNASWYQVIEMWIQGALEKCSSTHNHFSILYNNNPIKDVLSIIFPDIKNMYCVK